MAVAEPVRRKVCEERAHGILHLDVGVEDDVAAGVVDQAHRQLHLQLAAAGLGQLAADEAGPKHVQLRLAHGALQAEQKPVVEVSRVVQAVLVEDEGVREGADLEQPMPVGGAAGQAGDLQPQHQADLAQAHRGHELLEALPVAGRRPIGPGRCRSR